MDNSYHFFAIQIAFICPECKLTSKIRHLSEKHVCPHCNYTQMLSWKKDSALLKYLYESISESLDKNITITANLNNINLEVKQSKSIPCIECTQTLDITQTTKENIFCNHCNTPNLAEKLTIPFFELAFHTTRVWNKNTAFTAKCSACGANLPIKNKSRLQECSFCNTKNILTDEVWHSINPGLNLQPFYLLTQNTETLIKTIKQTQEINILATFAQHFYYKVRIAVAENRYLTADIARILAQDKNYYVREALKKHPDFHLWFEVKIFKDEKEAKQFAIDFPYETNPQLTLNEMLNLSQQKMPKRLVALCYNPAITPQVMKQILKQDIQEANLALSKRLDLTADIILLLAKTDNEEIHCNIADNPALPVIFMEKFALSRNKSIISVLLKNPALPQNIKKQITTL